MLSTSTTSLSLLFPNKTNQIHLSLFPNPSPNGSKSNSLFFLQQSHPTFHAILGQRHSGFRVCATKIRRKDGTGSLEVDGFHDEEDEDEDEEMEMFLPFGKMKKWLEDKPPGFGEGKVYDTSIEDNLVEEIEQTRQAQAANINNLKNSPVKPNSKKDEQKHEAPEVVPSGTRVRVVNLPKKKNIHRDLKSAFEGVPGIKNIIPAVFGNKKTRDPVCKGFVFVDFKSEADATRFVQKFSRQSIMFGKIQKQIRCEMANSHSTNSTHEQPAGDNDSASQLTVPGLEGDPTADFDLDDSSLGSWEETTSDGYDDPDDMLTTANLEDISENKKSVSVSELNGGASMEPKMESPTDAFSSKQQERIRALEKKLLAKGTGKKVAKGKAKRVAEGKDSSLGYWEETASDDYDDPDDMLITEQLDDISENMESVSVSELNGGASMEPKTESSTDAFSSKQRERIQALEKKLLGKGTGKKVAKGKGKKVAEGKAKRVAEGKGRKVPKLGIRGSAKKLKFKEKAVLTGVLSKYGVKAALALKEES